MASGTIELLSLTLNLFIPKVTYFSAPYRAEITKLLIKLSDPLSEGLSKHHSELFLVGLQKKGFLSQ